MRDLLDLAAHVEVEAIRQDLASPLAAGDLGRHLTAILRARAAASRPPPPITSGDGAPPSSSDLDLSRSSATRAWTAAFSQPNNSRQHHGPPGAAAAIIMPSPSTRRPPPPLPSKLPASTSHQQQQQGRGMLPPPHPFPRPLQHAPPATARSNGPPLPAHHGRRASSEAARWVAMVEEEEGLLDQSLGRSLSTQRQLRINLPLRGPNAIHRRPPLFAPPTRGGGGGGSSRRPSLTPALPARPARIHVSPEVVGELMPQGADNDVKDVRVSEPRREAGRVGGASGGRLE